MGQINVGADAILGTMTYATVAAAPTRPSLRHHLPFAATIGLLLLCVQRHAGFMVLFAVPFIAIWLVYNTVAALRRPAGRRVRAYKGAILALVLAAIAAVHGWYAHDARAHAQGAADAVLAFQAREGRFPAELADAGVDPAQLRRQWRLHYQLDGDRPVLFYGTTFTPFETHDFDFGTRGWVYRPD